MIRSNSIFFEKHIRPLFIEHCYACHSSETETSGGLALDPLRDGVKGTLRTDAHSRRLSREPFDAGSQLRRSPSTHAPR